MIGRLCRPLLPQRLADQRLYRPPPPSSPLLPPRRLAWTCDASPRLSVTGTPGSCPTSICTRVRGRMTPLSARPEPSIGPARGEEHLVGSIGESPLSDAPIGRRIARS